MTETTDVVERLKTRFDPRIVQPDELSREAAEEIERLRASERSAWNAAVVRDEQIDRLRARVAELEAHNQQLIDKLHCMCGSSMDHSAWEGHTPVSMYDYALSQAQDRIAELEAALRPLERHVSMNAMDRLIHEGARTVGWEKSQELMAMLEAARRALGDGHG